MIGATRLSRSKMIQYKARHGLGIEAALTMPRGYSTNNLPLIVMPHGGPWAHDILSYDYWTQFLADRGYVVLQPNFRGSTGYGTAFEKASKEVEFLSVPLADHYFTREADRMALLTAIENFLPSIIRLIELAE